MWWSPQRLAVGATRAGLQVVALGGRGQQHLDDVREGDNSSDGSGNGNASFGGAAGQALAGLMRKQMLRAQLESGTGDNDWHDWIVVAHAGEDESTATARVVAATRRLQ
jgi:hypothetical protein